MAELQSHHEDAGVHMFLQAKYSSDQGHSNVAIHCPDTDTLVCAMFYQDKKHSEILVISGTKAQKKSNTRHLSGHWG